MVDRNRKGELCWADRGERLARGDLGDGSISEWAEGIAGEGIEAFEGFLSRLLSANPNLPVRAERVLVETVRRLGPGAAAVLKRQIGRLILESQCRPEREAERRLVEEIRMRLEAAATRLLERGDLSASTGAARTDLVLARELSPRDVVRIEEEAALTLSDWKILEGHRNRVELVETSPRPLMRALAGLGSEGVSFLIDLWRDSDRLFRRDADLCSVVSSWPDPLPPSATRLDPAVRRDLVMALAEDDSEQTAGFLREVIQDHALRREYPRIHREARRPLVFRALLRWHEHGAAEGRRFSRSVGRLIDPRGHVRWERVESLVTIQLGQIARAVQLFLRQGKWFRSRSMASRTLAVEIGAMVDSVHLLLLVSEEFLSQVHGCRRFAEALFGLDRATLQAMRKGADAAVRRRMERSALRLMKRRRTMVDFVRGLRLVDEHTRERVLQMLDLATGQFPDLRTKNRALDLLAVPYQEQAAEQRLVREVRKRFRALVRVLHEDGLRVRLDREDFRLLEARIDDLRDLCDLMVASRDYLVSMLTRYENVSDDFIFAEEEYKAEIEGRLIRLLTRPGYGFVPRADAD